MTSAVQVGIVVRAKDRPWFLARALQDIAAQDFTGWKVCIVNDGGDAAAVEGVLADIPDEVRERVVVSHNTCSRGRSAAANQGIRELDSEHLVLHDDDDLWHPRFLSETVAWLNSHPDDIGVVVRTEIVLEEARDGGFVETGRETFWADIDEIRLSDLVEINRWVPISYLYRRVLHDRVGFYDEELHAAEDWDLGLRTLPKYRIGFLDGVPLAFWMHRPGIEGDLGNSMFALASHHERYDVRIRDAALREYVRSHGSGLPLFLVRQLREIVREEIGRALDARPSDMDRVRRRLRALRHGKS